MAFLNGWLTPTKIYLWISALLFLVATSVAADQAQQKAKRVQIPMHGTKPSTYDHSGANSKGFNRTPWDPVSTGGPTGPEVVVGGRGEKFLGDVDRDAVRRLVLVNMRTYKKCYEKELKKSPGLSGNFILRWTVGKKGQILNTKLKSSTPGIENVGACVAKYLRKWSFPPPNGQEKEYAVEFPWDFFVANK